MYPTFFFFLEKEVSVHITSTSINRFGLFTFLSDLGNKWALNGRCFKMCCCSKCTFSIHRCSSCSRLSVKPVIHYSIDSKDGLYDARKQLKKYKSQKHQLYLIPLSFLLILRFCGNKKTLPTSCTECKVYFGGYTINNQL